MSIKLHANTICPGFSDQLYIVSYYIKWVTTSWTHSTTFKFIQDILMSDGNGEQVKHV